MAGRPGAPPLAAALLLLPLLCATSLLPAAGAARHDAAPPRYKILTLIPMGGSSHTFDLVAVAGVLATRHDVTVVTPPSDHGHTAAAIKRLGDAAGAMKLEDVDALLSMASFSKGIGSIGKGGLVSMVRKMSQLPYWMAERCEQMLGNATLMESWRSYDVILTFLFPPPGQDTCTCLLGQALGIPVVHVLDMVLMEAPINVPQFGSGLSRAEVRGTWAGALKNAGFYALQNTLMKALAWAEVGANRKLRARLGLPLGRGGCRPVVGLLSSSWLLEEPQALEPHQIMVGPVSARPSSPVIPDPAIAAFAAEAAEEDGLVLISFGSVSSFFGSLLTKEDYVNLALAFADLAPVRVLWLLNPRGLPEGVTVEGLPLGNNTLMVPWGPINDVLGHPSCRAFVTHGGLKSTLEAMFHGVPIVGVPFMSEQLHNTQRAAARGFGVVSPQAPVVRKDGTHYTREGVASLIRKVLSPSYATAANQIGAAMRLAYSQKRPVDRAAEEVELALLHGGYSVEHSLAQARLREGKARRQGSSGGGGGLEAALGAEVSRGDVAAAVMAPAQSAAADAAQEL